MIYMCNNIYKNYLTKYHGLNLNLLISYTIPEISCRLDILSHFNLLLHCKYNKYLKLLNKKNMYMHISTKGYTIRIYNYIYRTNYSEQTFYIVLYFALNFIYICINLHS